MFLRLVGCLHVQVSGDVDALFLGERCLAFGKNVSRLYVRIEQSEKNFLILFCVRLNLLLFLEYYVTVTKKFIHKDRAIREEFSDSLLHLVKSFAFLGILRYRNEEIYT